MDFMIMYSCPHVHHSKVTFFPWETVSGILCPDIQILLFKTVMDEFVQGKRANRYLDYELIPVKVNHCLPGKEQIH